MIFIIKLSTGDEVIAECEYDDDSYFLTDPMAIVESQTESGVDVLKLIDYIMMAEESFITIPKKFVVGCYVPVKPMQEYYLKSVVYDRKNIRPVVNKMLDLALSNFDNKLADDVSYFKNKTSGGNTIQ